MERGYVGSVDSLAAVGCDFKTVVPTLSSWPTPFIYQDDPFNFQRMKAFIGMGTGESGIQSHGTGSLIGACPRFWR